MKLQVLLLILTFSMSINAETRAFYEFLLGNHQFTADVYKELLKSNSGNFLICPLSADILMSLVHKGAAGRTAGQIVSGLHLPELHPRLEVSLRELAQYFRDSDNYTLNTANKIYVKDGYNIRHEFESFAREFFDSEIQNIDFERNVQAAFGINKWVEEKTNGKIKNIVGADDFDKDTRAVLINAIYFEGKWTNAFSKRSTKVASFYANFQNAIYVPMMEQVNKFSYLESTEYNAKFLQLPYVGGDVTMTIALPNDPGAMEKLEQSMYDIVVLSEYENSRVHVALPKFKIDTTIDFKPILQMLGVVDAFEDHADFSGILVDQPLKLSKVVQKTFIEMTESGTTAAAATAGVAIVPVSAVYPPEPLKEFVADRPFLFFVQIRSVVLFAGKYTGPTY